VVDLDALAAALRDKHLGGAAVDVFPVEPSSNADKFQSPLQGLDNVILTPHIGGSTEEAQERIGTEVARKFVEYADNGSTTGAVNFPQVQLPPRSSGTRFVQVHHNSPGGLGRLNETFAQRGINVAAQYCQTDSQIGYVVVDIDGRVQGPEGLLADIRAIPGTISARLCLSRSTSRTFLISRLPAAIWLRPRRPQAEGPTPFNGNEPPTQPSAATRATGERSRKEAQPLPRKPSQRSSKPRSGV
jgi:D-3-phosphoglycerate dehydrogenase